MTFVSNTIESITSIMFFLGFAGVGRCSICFLYLMEFLPQDKQTLVGTILQMNNGFVSVYIAVFFWKISKFWYGIEIFAIILMVIAIIGIIIMPESPKFLLST